MDYFGIASEAWKTVRAQRALLGLGSVSAAYQTVFGVLVALSMLPLALVPLLTVSDRGVPTPLVERSFEYASAYSTIYLVVIVVLAAVVLVLAVFDVAAQGGLVIESNAAAEGRRASFAEGFAAGMRRWWRTAGLLALSALPGLLHSLALAALLFVTVTLPLEAGERIDPARVLVSYNALTPLSWAVTLLAVPLGVLVLLGLRFALLSDLPWQASLSEAWRMARSALGRVAAMYGVMLLVVLLAVWAAELAIGLLAAVFGAVAVFAAAAGLTWLAVAAGVVAVAVVAAGFFAMTTAVHAWWATSITLFWRRLMVPASMAPSTPIPAATDVAAPAHPNVPPAVSGSR